MRQSFLVLFVAALALSTWTGLALAQPAAPTPPESIARLGGEWHGTYTFSGLEQTDVSGPDTFTCTPAAAGFAMLCHEHSDGPMVSNGVYIIGQDIAGDGLLHMYTVTSDGFAHDHPGSYDGSGFTFEHIGPAGDQLFDERIHISFADDSSLTVSVQVFVGQTQVATWDVVMTK